MGKIEIDDNINFAGNVSNKLAGFYFTGNHTLISKGATFNKKLTTENDGEGKLHIEGNTEILAGIGENLRKFDEIKFLGDHTLLLSENDIHVKNIITDNNIHNTNTNMHTNIDININIKMNTNININTNPSNGIDTRNNMNNNNACIGTNPPTQRGRACCK